MSGLYRALRPALFALEAEEAHRWTLRTLSMGAARLFPPPPACEALAVSALGLKFLNPIGMAAGFDKNAEALAPLFALGFGFVEAGTVTPRPQPGNPRPRIFRLNEDDAVINRFGFNSEGANAVAARLARHRPAGILGLNIGANKETIDRAEDYARAFDRLHPFADYITINISSPNTPGLRGLQNRGELEALLDRMNAQRAALARALPLLVKVAPDLDDKAIEEIAETAILKRIDGLIVSNTTLARNGVKSPLGAEAGGLSGRPLFQLSTQVLAKFHRVAAGRLLLVGVGGIMSAADAYEKVKAGASLLQLYTGLVYEGPGLVRRILEGLADHLSKDGLAAIGAAVGVDSERLARSPGI